VVEQFWWAPGIYPGQTKTQTQTSKEKVEIKFYVPQVLLLLLKCGIFQFIGFQF